MATYDRKNQVQAEQFDARARPLPAQVQQVEHPRLGTIFQVGKARIQDTDWIVTLPDGSVVPVANARFAQLFQLAP